MLFAYEKIFSEISLNSISNDCILAANQKDESLRKNDSRNDRRNGNVSRDSFAIYRRKLS